jgi:hypothetical protein
MEYTKEQLLKAAKELNAVGFEPGIYINNKNTDKLYLEMVISVRVYSLISDGFERNKALAIKVFIDMMTDKLSKETLQLLRNLMENFDAKKMKKNLLSEIISDQPKEARLN